MTNPVFVFITKRHIPGQPGELFTHQPQRLMGSQNFHAAFAILVAKLLVEAA